MTLRIVFYKSSSKYYDSCCLQCEKFDHYVNEKSKNTLCLENEEIRIRKEEIRSILSIVKNWSKSEFYINEEKVDEIVVERILRILDCEKAKEDEVVGDHCIALNGWGCNYLEEIAYATGDYSNYYRNKYYWYQFGKFSDGIWIVDKERIKALLNSEADRKKIQICKYFDIQRIYAEVDKLPDCIVVDENAEECVWQYVYKDAPAGMKQTEIIGVEPKKDDHSYGGGFSIKIGGLSSRREQSKDIDPEQKNIPSISFEDIGGLEEVVQQVREVIELPMIQPQIFEYYHLTPHKGILLYGPPGCGKTMIAKAIAHEINAHFVAINGPEILNKYIGQSEENLRKIFDEARKHRPSIIYFDEFDSIAIRRDTEDHLSLSTVVNQLLTLMDGMLESNVCCIASTNRIDMIDEAIKRPGRFDYVIEIEKPSPEGCKAIFRIHTDHKPVDEGFDRDRFVEQHLTGLSGAEIAFVASEAAYNSIRRTIDMRKVFSGNEVHLTEDNRINEMDFVKAVKTLKERKKRADSAKYRYNM